MRAGVPIRARGDHLIELGLGRAAAAATLLLLAAATTWLVLAFGRPALVIALVVLVWALVRGDRRFRAGWLLVGAGTTALLFGGAQYARCAGAPGVGILECAPPDMSGYFAVAAALVGAGALLLTVPRRVTISPR